MTTLREHADKLDAENVARDAQEAKKIAELVASGHFASFRKDAPLEIARAVLNSLGSKTIRHHTSTFYSWRKTHYGAIEEDDLRKLVYAFLEKAKRQVKENFVPFDPTKGDVDRVIDALAAVAHVKSEIQAPAWLDGTECEPLIACTNGLLRVSDGVLLPHNPSYFNTSRIDCAYEPEAPSPHEWLRFLDSVWGEDPESIESLQDIFGYIVAGEQRFQKMFMIIGPKRAGKGTIAGVLTKLVGSGGHAGLTLASLSSNFGLAPLIGKSLAVVPDARLRGSSYEIVERLLAISGCDELTIDRKYKDAWTGRLGVRFLFLSNEVPALADSSGAVASRFIILAMKASFFGREDLGLAKRLEPELSGILNWALEGWRRLKARGFFIEPKTAKAKREILHALTSPVSTFIDERCVVEPLGEVDTRTLFYEWQAWAAQAGREHSGNDASFGRDLRAAVPSLESAKRRRGSRQIRVFVGIRLKNEEEVRHEAADLEEAQGAAAPADELPF